MKTCIICKTLLKGRQRKYCSKPCQRAGNYDKEYHRQWRISKGLIRSPGVGSGGNQLGKDNHRYKNGVGSYRKRALDHYGAYCNRCKSEKLLVVHHIDENRTNNALSNLEVLCKSCHQVHHEKRCTKTGRYLGHKEAILYANPVNSEEIHKRDDSEPSSLKEVKVEEKVQRLTVEHSKQ